MRAAIIGAAGTPYHDGIFFFDIAFPANYPARPPLIHYRSFGHWINPNLYASRLVCLSLLNTWHGKKSEICSPSGSTMLQVLVSIQGLVLNEKPYYNEPGTGFGLGAATSYWPCFEIGGGFFGDSARRTRAEGGSASMWTLEGEDAGDGFKGKAASRLDGAVAREEVEKRRCH
ncbi:putative ubiquitin-conjugating enzyme E2 25 [Turnera subulata]|uniref:Ubiquitin-conjugating enzyme E2 25 n=1 Tax=Turnera subulata TaxID=218843 RepID=A0A9Q0FY95_9ROSI|nr:putative ubiquitin-conjugating enzyme E2 25 [Turnera subulata]